MISVLGLGYIGLPTAIFLAAGGNRVYGYDIEQSKIETIENGLLPFEEAGLQELLQGVLRDGSFTASSLLKVSETYIICVPTPISKTTTGDVQADISYVFNAIDSILGVLKDDDLVILESTCPIGTSDAVETYIKKLRPDIQSLHIGYCPERVIPGAIMQEMQYNDRIIGANSEVALHKIRNLYSSFAKGRLHMTSAKAAEMAKLVENAFRDVNIAFANEISMLATRLNIDVDEVIELANMHPRVSILQPGPGVGGHCISVDPWFLISQQHIEMRLLKAARLVNDAKPSFVVELISAYLNKLATDCGRSISSIVVLGLTYKKDVDDTRNSPAMQIADMLEGLNYKVIRLDPYVHGEEPTIETFKESYSPDNLYVKLVAHQFFDQFSNQLIKPGIEYISYAG